MTKYPNVKIHNIIFIIFVIASSLICIEVVLRVFNYPYTGCKDIESPPENILGQYDPKLGWAYKPNSSTVIYNHTRYTFNADGYRSESIDSRTDFSKPIILIVGDSTLFGQDLNYTDTFGYKLQQKLNDSYQVLNFAVQGYGLDQAYLKLQQLMNKYKPVYVITDLIDDQDNRNAVRDRGSIIPCLKFRGTKPAFSINNNILVLSHKPEPYEIYNNPRIRLVLRRFIDVMNIYSNNKTALSKMIYQNMKQYVDRHGAKLLVINYLSKIRNYQTEGDSLGTSTVVFENYNKNYVNQDNWHPNSNGTTKMVSDIASKIR
jgi:hypothetical protein